MFQLVQLSTFIAKLPTVPQTRRVSQPCGAPDVPDTESETLPLKLPSPALKVKTPPSSAIACEHRTLALPSSAD